MIVGLILAGGAARRLGGIDKTLLELNGRPLLSHLIDCLAPQLDGLALSANGPAARFARFDIPVLADARPGIGPLAGLLRGLDWADALGARSLLTVPGDTPLVPADLATRLSPAPAMALSHGRRHPLVALWPVTCRDALAAHLDALDREAPRRAFGVQGFATALSMRTVDFGDQNPDPFFNVNTPEEWQFLSCSNK
jgi:molybdopterin-guanine dinucleotide biosynthesis protein A